MADDRMKNDDAQRNMGAGQKDQDYGQQSPGRTGPTGGQHAGQHGQQDQKDKFGGQIGGEKGTRNMEDDDEFATGGKGQTGGQNRGGQNR